MSKIYKTTDYGQFKFFEGNRPILTDRIYESVKKKNLLHLNPIAVNKEMKVLNGQHRLDAAKRLNVSIYYMIIENDEEQDMILLQTQTQWTQKDYLRWYKTYNSNYKFIDDICSRYGLYHNLTFVISYCITNHSLFSDFKKGTYKIKPNSEKIKNDFECLHEVKNKIKEIKDDVYLPKNTLAALMSIISNPQYIHKEFVKKIDMYRDKVIQSLRFREFKEVRKSFIENVYNHNVKNKELLFKN